MSGSAMTNYTEKYQPEIATLKTAKTAVIKARNELRNAMADDIDALEQAGDIESLRKLCRILDWPEQKIVQPAICRLGGGMGKRKLQS